MHIQKHATHALAGPLANCFWKIQGGRTCDAVDCGMAIYGCVHTHPSSGILCAASCCWRLSQAPTVAVSFHESVVHASCPPVVFVRTSSIHSALHQAGIKVQPDCVKAVLAPWAGSGVTIDSLARVQADERRKNIEEEGGEQAGVVQQEAAVLLEQAADAQKVRGLGRGGGPQWERGVG